MLDLDLDAPWRRPARLARMSLACTALLLAVCSASRANENIREMERTAAIAKPFMDCVGKHDTELVRSDMPIGQVIDKLLRECNNAFEDMSNFTIELLLSGRAPKESAQERGDEMRKTKLELTNMIKNMLGFSIAARRCRAGNPESVINCSFFDSPRRR